MPPEGVTTAASTELAIEAYGVRFAVAVDDPGLMPAVTATLPPGWTHCEQVGKLTRFLLASPDGITYELTRDESPISQPVDLEVAIGVLDSNLRMEIARRASGWAFIHAGCVAVDDRALVLPGLSFSGKTTLVSALIGQGAMYFSDEYALLDSEGLVHPYPKPLSIRPAGANRSQGLVPATETAAADLGAQIGDRAAAVALIAALNYQPGATWDPAPLTPSQGALALLSHSVTVRDEPERVLAAARRAAYGARCLEGTRGEAEAVASILLALLDER
jgi:hypothetical protein